MKTGFYPALGTPLDDMGYLVPESMEKQIQDQIAEGAAGLLVMGSMGIEPYIKHSEYRNVAARSVDAAEGKCPVLVGVMDNSISRVVERIESLKGLKIDGIVATTPYYYASSPAEIKNYFESIAKKSPFPLYLYDLPVVTKVKITTDVAEYLMSVDNIKGIKTGDIVTAKELIRSDKLRNDFDIMFSGLDVFDTAYKYGINKNLDGMFSCTPATTGKMYRALETGDFELAGKLLDDILKLRNTLVGVGVFSGFTYAMNILGYKGIFSPDYMYRNNPEDFNKVRECMEKLNII